MDSKTLKQKIQKTMPKSKEEVSVTALVPVTSIRREVELKSTSAVGEALALMVETNEDYQQADMLLSRITEAEKVINDKLFIPSIQPIRKGLDALYELQRELKAPLENARKELNQKMKNFRLLEARKLREADEAKQAEIDRLQREAEEKERRAMEAKTPQMRSRLMNQSAALQDKAVEATAAPLPVAPVEVNSSTYRPIVRWRVSDMAAFLQGVLEEKIPLHAVQVDNISVNALFRSNKEAVAAWPGIELYEDIQIVRR